MKFLLFVTLLTLFNTRISRQGQWVIDSSSQLLIHGKSNVNEFTCSISKYSYADTLHYTVNNTELIFGENTMTIPVQDFDCGNSIITKDLRRTVKAVKNPHLVIAFISMDRSRENSVTAHLAITLAGVTKHVNLEFAQRLKGDLLQLTGKQVIAFKDFGLVAPRHLLGLVKVQKELQVEFKLVVKTVSH